MRYKRLWVLLAGIVLISAAFLLLNFKAAVSSTQIIQRINITKLDGHYPDRLGPTDKISLVLVGEGPLARALQKALAKNWDARIGRFEPVQELKPKYSSPALVIYVSSANPNWTPFFALNLFSIQAGYATNGDMTFLEGLDKTKPYIRNSDPSVVDLYTEYEINDRSFGLISRPGYDQYLADDLAKEIVNTLKNLYNIQDPGGG